MQARTGRELLVDIVSDHGSTLVKGRNVSLDKQLKVLVTMMTQMFTRCNMAERDQERNSKGWLELILPRPFVMMKLCL